MKKLFLSAVALIVIAILPIKAAFSGGHYEGPDLSGQKVVVFGPWMAPQDDDFRDVVSIFEKATGATVEYGGSDEFEQRKWWVFRRLQKEAESFNWRAKKGKKHIKRGRT